MVIPSLCTLCLCHPYLDLLRSTSSFLSSSPTTMATDDATGPSGEQYAQLLTAIQASQQRMDDQLEGMRAEIRQSQEDAASKAVKSVRRDKPYAFRKKGNVEQAAFVERVTDVIAEAETELRGLSTGATSPAVERAQRILEQGAKLVAERLKLIKIADRSEFGWDIVSEYTADELADDSDDEKRLEKAEKAAERKAAKRKRKVPTWAVARGRAGQQAPGAAGASSYMPPVGTLVPQVAAYPRCPLAPAGSRTASPFGAVLRLWRVGSHPELLTEDRWGRRKAGSGILLMSVMLVYLVGK